VQVPSADAKKNAKEPKDKRSIKEIFMERVHKMMEADPVFNNMGKKKQSQAMVDAIYSDKMIVPVNEKEIDGEKNRLVLGEV
jgi:hypothetical protein